MEEHCLSWEEVIDKKEIENLLEEDISRRLYKPESCKIVKGNCRIERGKLYLLLDWKNIENIKNPWITQIDYINTKSKVNANITENNLMTIMGRGIGAQSRYYNEFFRAFIDMKVTYDNVKDSLNGLPLSQEEIETVKLNLDKFKGAIPIKTIENYLRNPVEFFKLNENK